VALNGLAEIEHASTSDGRTGASTSSAGDASSRSVRRALAAVDGAARGLERCTPSGAQAGPLVAAGREHAVQAALELVQGLAICGEEALAFFACALLAFARSGGERRVELAFDVRALGAVEGALLQNTVRAEEALAGASGLLAELALSLVDGGIHFAHELLGVAVA